jgi:hypothetical protein
MSPNKTKPKKKKKKKKKKINTNKTNILNRNLEHVLPKISAVVSGFCKLSLGALRSAI